MTGDETIVFKGVTVDVQKETDRMSKLEVLQMTANPIDMGIIGPQGRAIILKDVAEELGMDGEKIVPSPEQLGTKPPEQPPGGPGGGTPGGPKAAQAPSAGRDPAMAVREGQENVTRGVVQ